MANFYLMNENGNSKNIINLDYGVTVFADISGIDLKTSQITRECGKDSLYAYNKGYELSDIYYILKKFKNGNFSAYYPLFKSNNDSLNQIIRDFEYFAKQRFEKVNNNDKVTLDPDKKFYDFVDFIIADILYSGRTDLSSKECLISSYIKELLYKKYSEFYNCSTSEFLNMKKYSFHKQLLNYTDLRNLVISYIRWKQGQSADLRHIMKEKENYDYSGINFPEENTDYTDELIEYFANYQGVRIQDQKPVINTERYEQMELTDFFDHTAFVRVHK